MSMNIVSRFKGHEFNIPYVVYYKTTVATPKTALAKMYEEKNEMFLKLKVPKTSYKEPMIQELLQWGNTNVKDESYYRDIAVYVEVMGGFEQTVAFTHASIVTKVEADTEGDMVTIFVNANQKRDKFVGVMFGDTLEETCQKALERVNNPPRMNIVIPVVNKQDTTITDTTIPLAEYTSKSNDIEYTYYDNKENIKAKKVNKKSNKRQIRFNGNKYFLLSFIVETENGNYDYYKLNGIESILSIFGGKLYENNKFEINMISPSTKEKKTINIDYTELTDVNNPINEPILINKDFNNEIYISIDYILNIISGLYGYNAYITKDNVVYSIFPKSVYNNKKVGYFEDYKYYIYDDYQLVQTIAYINHTFSDKEVLEMKIKSSVVGFSPFLTKFIKKGSGTLGDTATVLLGAIGIAKAIKEYKTVDTGKIGGLYYRSFYSRKIVDKSTGTVNVPVPYKYAYIDIFYDSQEMNNIAYIEITGDPVYKSDNNW